MLFFFTWTLFKYIINEQNVHCSFFIWQVQSDHFHEIFAPELDKHGYQALYKRKTNEVGSFDSIPLPHTPSFMLESLLTVAYSLMGS